MNFKIIICRVSFHVMFIPKVYAPFKAYASYSLYFKGKVKHSYFHKMFMITGLHQAYFVYSWKYKSSFHLRVKVNFNVIKFEFSKSYSR